jgi:hypothetical protein
VNMELFDQYLPAEGEQSEVRAGNSGADSEADPISLQSMGHTDNVLESARCAGLYNSTCTWSIKQTQADLVFKLTGILVALVKLLLC